MELGKIQKLKVLRNTSVGVYLNSESDKRNDDVLLPQKQVPEGTKVGDEIEVFIYRDSKDRMIATTKKSRLTIGQITVLRVVDTTKIGAFLDWGLEKDLFLPFKQQTTKVRKGKEYLVSLYIDKSNRLCATMDISTLLSSNSPYKENDKVHGTIYDISKDIGLFVAVDNKYYGLIPKNEVYGYYEHGDKVDARVTKIREDGKLNLSFKEKAYRQMDKDSEIILDKLNDKGGVIALNDNSSPNVIKNELNMSKRAFKRAVGRLLKEEKIKFTKNGIKKL